MKHRLVMLNTDGAPMSRDEMKQALINSGFTVPEVEPLYVVTLPDRPTEPRIIWNGVMWMHNPVWVDYYNQYAHEKALLNADKQRYVGDMEAVEVMLMNTFPKIETYVKTGQDARGVPVWDWVAFDPPKYSYKSCTMWLTGVKRPENVIDFICDGYFGS